MKDKKVYQEPEMTIVIMTESLDMMSASFEEEMQSTDPLTDPDEIL